MFCAQVESRSTAGFVKTLATPPKHAMAACSHCASLLSSSRSVNSAPSAVRRPSPWPTTAAAATSQEALSAADQAQEIRQSVTREIRLLGKQRKPRQAVETLAGMARKGVQPDAQAVTALMDACCRNGQIDMAREIFANIFGQYQDLEPDDISFAVLVKGYGACSPPQWAAISQLIGEMESKWKQQPSTAVFNTLLAICARTKDQERGVAVLERMLAAGVQPDEFTLKAVSQRKTLRTALSRMFEL